MSCSRCTRQKAEHTYTFTDGGLGSHDRKSLRSYEDVYISQTESLRFRRRSTIKLLQQFFAGSFSVKPAHVGPQNKASMERSRAFHVNVSLVQSILRLHQFWKKATPMQTVIYSTFLLLWYSPFRARVVNDVQHHLMDHLVKLWWKNEFRRRELE